MPQFSIQTGTGQPPRPRNHHIGIISGNFHPLQIHKSTNTDPIQQFGREYTGQNMVCHRKGCERFARDKYRHVQVTGGGGRANPAGPARVKGEPCTGEGGSTGRGGLLLLWKKGCRSPSLEADIRASARPSIYSLGDLRRGILGIRRRSTDPDDVLAGREALREPHTRQYGPGDPVVSG